MKINEKPRILYDGITGAQKTITNCYDCYNKHKFYDEDNPYTSDSFGCNFTNEDVTFCRHRVGEHCPLKIEKV